MTVVALDTSVVVALLVRSHEQHEPVRTWCARKRLALAGHAAAESYSVLTRLPGDLRLGAADAERLLSTGFEPAVPALADRVVERLAEVGVTGGAVYDALVALAALDAGVPLATRDARAVPTYARVGVQVQFVR